MVGPVNTVSPGVILDVNIQHAREREDFRINGAGVPLPFRATEFFRRYSKSARLSTLLPKGAVGRVRDGVPAWHSLINLRQGASSARNGAGLDILEFSIYRARYPNRRVGRASISVAACVLRQRAPGTTGARKAGKRGRYGGRRGRFAGQEVNAPNGILKAAVGILGST